MVNTVLFDLDGTLLDTNQLIIDNCKEVFKNFLPHIKMKEEDYLYFIGPPLKESFAKYSNSPKEIEKLIYEYRRINNTTHDKKIKIYDHVYEVIKYLHDNKYNLGIVSSKKTELVERGLKLFNLDSFFPIIIGSEDVINHKPHPESILKAIQCFNNVDEVIYVGDSKGDILAAKNANVKSVGVSWSYKLKDLIESKPDYMIDDFSQLISLLE